MMAAVPSPRGALRSLFLLLLCCSLCLFGCLSIFRFLSAFHIFWPLSRSAYFFIIFFYFFLPLSLILFKPPSSVYIPLPLPSSISPFPSLYPPFPLPYNFPFLFLLPLPLSSSVYSPPSPFPSTLPPLLFRLPPPLSQHYTPPPDGRKT